MSMFTDQHSTSTDHLLKQSIMLGWIDMPQPRTHDDDRLASGLHRGAMNLSIDASGAA